MAVEIAPNITGWPTSFAVGSSTHSAVTSSQHSRSSAYVHERSVGLQKWPMLKLFWGVYLACHTTPQ